MVTTPLHGTLGLAQRAGRLASGQDAVRLALTAGKVYLLLLAKDAAPRTKQSFVSQAEQLNIPWLEAGTMEEFGMAIGKPDRAVIAVLDQGFATSIFCKTDTRSTHMEVTQCRI